MPFDDVKNTMARLGVEVQLTAIAEAMEFRQTVAMRQAAIVPRRQPEVEEVGAEDAEDCKDTSPSPSTSLGEQSSQTR